MRLPLPSQPHPFIQSTQVRFIRTGGLDWQDINRAFTFEFDQPAHLHDIVVDIARPDSGIVSGNVQVNVYFEYKMTDVPDSAILGVDEGSSYVPLLLRTYTSTAAALLTANVTVMQGAFLNSTSTTTDEHEHLPKLIPMNTRLTFVTLDNRSATEDTQETVRVRLGVIASAAGGSGSMYPLNTYHTY